MMLHIIPWEPLSHLINVQKQFEWREYYSSQFPLGANTYILFLTSKTVLKSCSTLSRNSLSLDSFHENGNYFYWHNSLTSLGSLKIKWVSGYDYNLICETCYINVRLWFRSFLPLPALPPILELCNLAITLALLDLQADQMSTLQSFLDFFFFFFGQPYTLAICPMLHFIILCYKLFIYL